MMMAAQREAASMIETQAVYENGVLRPLSPLPLRERQTVSLSIQEPQTGLDELFDTSALARKGP